MVSEPILVVDPGAHATSAALIIDGAVTLLREPVTGANSWRTDRTAGLSDLLARIRDHAQRLCSDPLLRLTITIPAGYPVPDPRRDAMIEAGETAGFPDVELLGDASAAALCAQAAGVIGDRALVIICDLGESWTSTLARSAATPWWSSARKPRSPGVIWTNFCSTISGRRESGPSSRPGAATSPGARRLRAAMRRSNSCTNSTQPRLRAPDLQAGCTRPARSTRCDASGSTASPSRACAGSWPVAAACSPGPRPACPPLPVVRPRPPSSGLAVGSTLTDVAMVLLVGGGACLPTAERVIGQGLGRPVRRSSDPDLAVLRGAVEWVLGSSAGGSPPTIRSGESSRCAGPSPAAGAVVRWRCG